MNGHHSAFSKRAVTGQGQGALWAQGVAASAQWLGRALRAIRGKSVEHSSGRCGHTYPVPLEQTGPFLRLWDGLSLLDLGFERPSQLDWRKRFTIQQVRQSSEGPSGHDGRDLKVNLVFY